jgi:hypothetical protein
MNNSEVHDCIENKNVLSIENMATCIHILEKLNLNMDDTVQFLLEKGAEMKQNNLENETHKETNMNVDNYMKIIDICSYDENKKVCLKHDDFENYILEQNADRDKLLQFINKMEINIIE